MPVTFPREDGSYALGSPAEQARRIEMLREPHMARLSEFVEKMRDERGPDFHIPYFDPEDGGVRARVLFLLEAPGPKAVKSGFVSRDNPDPTARNLRFLLQEADIERRDSVVWNIVPWYIGADDQSKIRAAKGADVTAGAVYLPRLLSHLPHLRAVVLVGRSAQKARKKVASLTSSQVFETFHPSNQVVVCQPLLRDQLREDLREIAKFLAGTP